MRKYLGDRIKHYRERAGIDSQTALAEVLKIDVGTVWRWENGKFWPSYSSLEAMAKIFGINIEQFFEQIRTPPKPKDDSLQRILGLLSSLDDSKWKAALEMLEALASGRADAANPGPPPFPKESRKKS